MQCVIPTSRRHRAGASGVQAIDPERLAAAFGLRGFQVQVLALSDDARANQPDAILTLRQGREQVLVHAYACMQGAMPQGAVRQLALDAFQAGADRAMLIAAAGFTVAAYQAALHHDALELVDEQGLGMLLDASSTHNRPSVSPPSSPREATRPAWPLRAAIGVSGTALALVMVFASMPSLQGQVLGLLHPARPTGVAFAQASAEPWRAPSQSRSGELDLPALESRVVSHQATFATAGALPANFNQALSVPRL